jgi:signal transduction histidine kinase
MQIRKRLAIQFSLLVSAILIASFSVLYFLEWESTLLEFQKRLHDKALTSAILLLKVDQVDSALLKTIDLSKKDVLYRENISVFTSQRKSLYTNNDSLDFAISDLDFKRVLEGEVLYLSENDFEIVALPFHYKGENFVIVSGAIDREGSQRLSILRKLLYGLILFLVAFVYWAGWVFAGRALNPIVRVMDEVQKISPVELSQRLSGDEKPDEIGRLIATFNRLLNRIENAFNLQKSFVTNVSHELKNPLTKITSQLEVTLLNERPAEEYKKTIQSVLEDIKELNQLSTSLLDLAFVNQENQTFLMTSIRADEVLWEIREDVSALNPLYRVQIHASQMPESEDDLFIKANLQWLKTAIGNIVENACKFSNDHTAVVSLYCYKKEIKIKVMDHGPGIDPKDVQKIFHPFYRTNRTSKIKGYGIGLSLAQKIITIHGGDIQVNSSPGVGTEITVTLQSVSNF